MAKFDIKVTDISTNEDGHKVASGTLDGRPFQAVAKEQDSENRDLYKVGGSLEDNEEFGRGERIAIARAARKGVTSEPEAEVETTEEVGAEASAEDTVGQDSEESLEVL